MCVLLSRLTGSWVLCDRLNGYISSKGKERLSFVWRNVSMLTLEVEPVRQIANCNSNHGHTEGLSPSIIHDGSFVNSSIQKFNITLLPC